MPNEACSRPAGAREAEAGPSAPQRQLLGATEPEQPLRKPPQILGETPSCCTLSFRLCLHADPHASRVPFPQCEFRHHLRQIPCPSPPAETLVTGGFRAGKTNGPHAGHQQPQERRDGLDVPGTAASTPGPAPSVETRNSGLPSPNARFHPNRKQPSLPSLGGRRSGTPKDV